MTRLNHRVVAGALITVTATCFAGPAAAKVEDADHAELLALAQGQHVAGPHLLVGLADQLVVEPHAPLSDQGHRHAARLDEAGVPEPFVEPETDLAQRSDDLRAARAAKGEPGRGDTRPPYWRRPARRVAAR